MYFLQCSWNESWNEPSFYYVSILQIMQSDIASIQESVML